MTKYGKNDRELCPGCGSNLPEPVMCSISHTIKPGAHLCIACGQKESTDPGWADAQRIGWKRAEAATESTKKLRKLKEGEQA